ncbi:MAG TPA: hypothetical protein PLD23_17270 [Armatimonadota bacterium]|nr:hypothetical protein [Armatimonadota bacterium]
MLAALLCRSAFVAQGGTDVVTRTVVQTEDRLARRRGVSPLDLRQHMRRHLGMVVPVYFPEDFDPVQTQDLLLATLADTELFVDPSRQVLVLDGVRWVNETARRVADQVERRAGAPLRVVCLDDNRGKGGAVCAGMIELLADPAVTHIGIRDDDGDHAIWDLPELYALSLQMAEDEATDLTLANGRRAEIHRPLGMARGFLEALVGEVTYDAVRFALARENRALNTRWHSAYGPVPDMESGYKIYSRRAAGLMIHGIQAAATRLPSLNLGHFGVEIVPTVEVLLAGGIVGEVMRTTCQAQPLTTFAAGTRLPQLFGAELVWLFTRLDTPAHVADTLLLNAQARCGYGQCSEGRQALAELRAFVLDHLGVPEAQRPEVRLPERF